jgi:hypothetical protein
VEAEDQHETADREQPVDLRDIDLPLRVRRGVPNADAGKVAEQHSLARE